MWQDWAIAIVQVVFIVALVPSLLHREHKPALWTSIPTSLGLAVIAVSYMTLGLFWSALASSAMTLGWAILAYQRLRTS